MGNGTDSMDYAKRVFNPWKQQMTNDEECKYIKKWIPELADVPPLAIHKWNMTCDKYINQGVKYPKPIVDHFQATKETIAIYDQYLKPHK